MAWECGRGMFWMKESPKIKVYSWFFFIIINECYVRYQHIWFWDKITNASGYTLYYSIYMLTHNINDTYLHFFQLVLFYSEKSHFELLECPCRKQQMISLNRLVSKIIFANWATIYVYYSAKTIYETKRLFGENKPYFDLNSKFQKRHPPSFLHFTYYF